MLMNWDEMGYFTLMAFVGLSTLTVCVGLTVRLFLAPVLREVADRMATRPRHDERLLTGRIEQLEDRLTLLESGLDRIEAAQDFDRHLGAVGPRKSESA
jgi:hypothetical protein